MARPHVQSGSSTPELIAGGLVFEVRPDLGAVPGSEPPDNTHMLVEDAASQLPGETLEGDNEIPCGDGAKELNRGGAERVAVARMSRSSTACRPRSVPPPR